MNKLRIITNESPNIGGGLLVTDNKESPSISFANSEGTIINITGEDGTFRPIYSSELNNKLIKRDWNITERKYISSEKLRLKIQPSTGDIDIIMGSTVGIDVCNLEGISEESIESFREEFESILSTMTKNEIYFYNSIKSVVDILNGTLVLSIIDYESDSYTNTVNLKPLINSYPYESVKGKVDLNIQYSKLGKIYNKEITFEAFRYEYGENGLEVISNNIIEELEVDVVMEYYDNLIRVLPKSREVNECIISNCTITYGNI